MVPEPPGPTPTATPVRRSPLDAEHRALGARLTPFGGWEMPLQYAGVLEEHRACRTDAVVFDVSHLGTVRAAGPGVHRALQWAFTNDLDRIGPGRAQYTHLCDPADGHVVDDLIVWWLAPEHFAVMPNASNTGPLVGALTEAVRDRGDAADVVEDVTGTRAVLAVQGPRARERAGPVLGDLATVARFAVAQGTWSGAPCVAAGTGYTGEDGFEVQVPTEAAPALWRELIAAGIAPAGLGARDTLRLEAGLPLHGHELGPGITPLQVGLDWVVRFDKGDFRGRDPLERERVTGPARRLRGLRVEGRRPPRQGCAVLDPAAPDGEPLGTVTSGNFSPVLGCGIGLALLRPDVADGTPVVVDIRGSRVAATVVGSRVLATA